MWSHLFIQYKLVPLQPDSSGWLRRKGCDGTVTGFSTVVLFPEDSAEKDRKPATNAPVKRQQLAVFTAGLAPLGSL